MTGNIYQTELPGRQQPRVARYDAACLVDEHGDSPSPLADSRGDLIDLLGAVRPGVAGVWRQRRNRAPLDFICWPHSFHNSPFYRRNLIFFPGAQRNVAMSPGSRILELRILALSMLKWSPNVAPNVNARAE